MISSKYGNVIRVSEIASSPRAGSSLNPGARMAITSGMNNQATTSRTTWAANSSVKMRSANNLAEASP